MESRDYHVWRGNNTEILHTKYEYGLKLPFEESWDPVSTHGWFHDNWHRSITISVFYVLAMHAIQRAMKDCFLKEDSKPLVLRPLLFSWNVLLAVFSICGCWRFSEEFFYALRTYPIQSTVCYSVDPTGVAAFWSSLFAFSKVAELFDTVFIVLRKRPLIFLHYYHHAGVLVLSWHAGRELTAAGRWFIWMNYTVHAFMYTYYAITSTGKRLPKAISMLITTLQTSQMLVGVGVSFYAYHLKRQGFPCQQSDENLHLSFGIYVTFALLFIKFFYDSYIAKKAPSTAKKTQ